LTKLPFLTLEISILPFSFLTLPNCIILLKVSLGEATVSMIRAGTGESWWLLFGRLRTEERH
jgi:hypothetical protein